MLSTSRRKWLRLRCLSLKRSVHPPRLTRAAMVKLTPELLAQAPSALNPVKERQLDLRGELVKISCISNHVHLIPKVTKSLLLKTLV